MNAKTYKISIMLKDKLVTAGRDIRHSDGSDECEAVRQ